jgi:hypothetical protein
VSGGSKFSSEVPKGDAWGVEDAIADAVDEFMKTGVSPMIPSISILDIKEVKILPGGAKVAVVRVRRLEALTTLKAIREAQRMLLKEWENRRGEGAVLPFEEKEIIEAAFGHLNVELIEQDEAEAKEDEDMSEPDRLRKHMTSVHNHRPDEVSGWDDLDVRRTHHDEHQPDAQPGMPAHDEDWWAWRRVDLEAAEADPDNDTGDPDDDPTDAVTVEVDIPGVQFNPGEPED